MGSRSVAVRETSLATISEASAAAPICGGIDARADAVESESELRLLEAQLSGRRSHDGLEVDHEG